MPRFRFADIARLSSALVLAGTCAWAAAAELGDPALRSYMGQPLIADIELTALADPAQAVSVRLANPDVYRAANIAMHPVLASVTMTVMRREGKQFLHITSVKPVDTEYMHLFLDLGDGAKRNIRAATLWLTPDPSAAPVPVARPAAPVAAELAPAEQAQPSVPRLRAGGAACPQQFSAEQVKACAATDYRNGLLSAQIVELEEKVKALQLAMESRVDAAPAKVAAPAKPVASAPLAPPAAVARQASGFPWLLWSGFIVLLAAIGGGVYFFLSRRKSISVEGAAADSVAWYARLAARFKRKPKAILPTEEEAPKSV